MSAVIAEPAAEAAPIRRPRKKIIVIAAAVLALVLAFGAGAVVFLKQRAARAAATAVDGDVVAGEAAGGSSHVDPKNVPIYLPLDPFVVNLADRDGDRYAQIGITFELDSNASGEEIKAYMPAIRNAILMVLANKTSKELLNREGKELLAQEIQREAARPMGIEAAVPEPVLPAPSERATSAVVAASAPASAIAVASLAPARAKALHRNPNSQRNPIQHVHFSSFIIQ
jgi:flagellar FliL protein